jgi:Protein phosphatase 2C
MRLFPGALWVAKDGNAQFEYEDACWTPRQCNPLEGQSFRFAVADGATDAVFSGLWAQILVRAFGKRNLTANTNGALISRLRKMWSRSVGHRPLPWYAEEKLRSGAFAALIGFELVENQQGGTGTWTATACGDCCLFQVRGPNLVTAFPITSSEQFTNSPHLLCSIGPGTDDFARLSSTAGEWMEGDCFYLMTDALANWFLVECETRCVPWQTLRDITLPTDPPFGSWIEGLRRAKQIRNDDCTLLSIGFEHY